MRITERQLRNIIKEEILSEADKQGTLEFRGGASPDAESYIPYEFTQHTGDNRIIITNKEPDSKLSVRLGFVKPAQGKTGEQRFTLVSIKDLATGTHQIAGPSDMKPENFSHGYFTLYITLMTRNGNELKEGVYIRRPKAIGFDLTVGR